MQTHDKFMAYRPKDGAESRKKKRVKAFLLDIDCVTNKQFSTFVEETGYITDAEKYKWSFVLENLASPDVIDEADSGLGRVKDAKEWLAVKVSYECTYNLHVLQFLSLIYHTMILLILS
jgi:formylglycine-generating enzyme required for sulfatase activity